MTEQHSPYAPPATSLGVSNLPVELPDASRSRRFGTLLIDYLGMIAMFVVAAVAIMLMFGEAGNAFLERTPDALIGLPLQLGYYLLFEGLWGRTPGKFIMGTLVVTATGLRPRFMQVFKRTLCRFIPFEPLSFFGQRGWHDSISDTRVVRMR